MSWHTSAISIEGDQAQRGPALFADLGFPGLTAVSEVSGEEAGSGGLPGRALGLIREWTMVFDPWMFVAPDASVPKGHMWSAQLETALLTLSESRRIYFFITEGVSATHAFAWYAQGQRTRRCVWQDGTVVMEDGEPLPEEIQAMSEEPDEEQRLFLIMEKLTGVSMVDDVFAGRFKVFA
jgi:hypothetical protein